MPAAAVIPAPIAYINVVAVKKLVVGLLAGAFGPPLTGCVTCTFLRPSLARARWALSCPARDRHHLL